MFNLTKSRRHCAPSLSPGFSILSRNESKNRALSVSPSLSLFTDRSWSLIIPPSRDNQRKLVWRLYLPYGSYGSDSISLVSEQWERLRCLLSPLCIFYMSKRSFLSLPFSSWVTDLKSSSLAASRSRELNVSPLLVLTFITGSLLVALRSNHCDNNIVTICCYFYILWFCTDTVTLVDLICHRRQ